ncbi:hypothetical protein [Dyadobacter sp. 22481]|uniref:hypothetical protein n=1 Tax=Dyadobacter sp. 22481 TaxID=3453926 RepID=UPI003F87280D
MKKHNSPYIMKFKFENLTDETRQLMISEIKLDVGNEQLYYSKRFCEQGHNLYADLLLSAVEKGDEQSLALALKQKKCFAETEIRNTKKGPIYSKVPENANLVFAESEFNRFYMRALALQAAKAGETLSVYRARYSENPREESNILIGKIIDPTQLLDDLRKNIGLDTVLGLPPGPNSGLSVKLQ